uniref:Tumor necrosis factor receptor superfamily member 5 n=1 Tax=Astyanax mexicanus TaxID=7994 RepID=A0A8B9GVZ9_ASTMX
MFYLFVCLFVCLFRIDCTRTAMAVFAVSAVLFLYVELCSGACNSLQFEIDGKCCSMCEPGKNCTKDTQTRCFPCGDSCYSSEPNHYSECKKCTVCDSGLGLRVKTSCTAFSDSVCEVLDGHYCTDRTGESCSRALRHAPCSPGQFIVNTGVLHSQCCFYKLSCSLFVTIYELC